MKTRKAPELPPRWRWQQEALDETCAGLAHQDYRYLHAPMATGKTRAMYDLCEAPQFVGARVVTVAMAKLVRQHLDKFRHKFGCLPVAGDDEEADLISPTGQRIFILTWQRLASWARRGVNPLGPQTFCVICLLPEQRVPSLPSLGVLQRSAALGLGRSSANRHCECDSPVDKSTLCQASEPR